MRLWELGLLYLLVGAGGAAAVLAKSRAEAAQRALDTALVLLFWPLYGPFLWMGSALARPGGASPLERLAADGREAIARRVDAAEAKLAELDALLSRPELSAAAAEARRTELRARGDAVGERLAHNRLRAIERVHEIRAHFARELDQVRELMLQLEVQGELVKLAGEGDGGTRELLAELSVKVECLDEIVRTGFELGAVRTVASTVST